MLRAEFVPGPDNPHFKFWRLVSGSAYEFPLANFWVQQHGPCLSLSLGAIKAVCWRPTCIDARWLKNILEHNSYKTFAFEKIIQENAIKIINSTVNIERNVLTCPRKSVGESEGGNNITKNIGRHGREIAAEKERYNTGGQASSSKLKDINYRKSPRIIYNNN